MILPFCQSQGLSSPSSRRAWIEIVNKRAGKRLPLSPSSRRAWIEIWFYAFGILPQFVALLAEGVDRNELDSSGRWTRKKVALLAEGVDRNTFQGWCYTELAYVALLAEGVDRNILGVRRGENLHVALLAEGVDRNARRNLFYQAKPGVALLAEGVDRNHGGGFAPIGYDCRPPRGGRG